METEQVAAAVNQMAATTQEVANHVQRTADATQEANRLTSQGRQIAGETREAIERLSQRWAKPVRRLPNWPRTATRLVAWSM